MDYARARKTARGWRPPYTVMQAAWMRALGVRPRRRAYSPSRREVRECMDQRTGVRHG